MIVDCFTLFNELDILRLRLNELAAFVDYFVVVEANKTHTGRPKPFFLAEYAPEFSSFSEKIVYGKVDDMPVLRDDTASSKWVLENFQRNCVARGLSVLPLTSEDTILISDLDEIPDPNCFRFLPKLLSEAETVNFVLRNYRYFFNYRIPGLPQEIHWLGTVACKASYLAKNSPEQVRRGDNPPRAGYTPLNIRQPDRCYLENSGWHVSSFGGPSINAVKMQNVVEGDLHHVENSIVPMLRPNHNWKLGRETPECCQWIENKRPYIKPVSTDMKDIPRYIPMSVLKSPRDYEYFFWTNEVFG